MHEHTVSKLLLVRILEHETLYAVSASE